MKKIKILIANKYFLMNYAIRCILQRINGFEVTGVPSSQVEEEIIRNKPDILLIEVDFNKIQNADLINKIRNRFPEIKILLLIDMEDKENVMQFLKMQLEGYLLKNTSRKELIHAVNVVYKGEKFYSKEIQNLLHEIIIEKHNSIDESSSQLSRREKEILELIIAGMKNKEIADSLFISEYTAQTHRRNIMKKLNVKSTPQLILTSLKKNNFTHQ